MTPSAKGHGSRSSRSLKQHVAKLPRPPSGARTGSECAALRPPAVGFGKGGPAQRFNGETFQTSPCKRDAERVLRVGWDKRGAGSRFHGDPSWCFPLALYKQAVNKKPRQSGSLGDLGWAGHPVCTLSAPLTPRPLRHPVPERPLRSQHWAFAGLVPSASPPPACPVFLPSLSASCGPSTALGAHQENTSTPAERQPEN